MKKYSLFLFALFTIVFVNSQITPQFCFKPMNYTTAGLTNPHGIATGDFNGDGKIDLATANNGLNSVTVLLGSGTGSFGTMVNYGVGTSPWGITSADFNGDGKPDLAVANSGGTTISVLLATVSGNFATAIDYTVGYYPKEIISADFNGDGKPDLATTNSGGNDVSIFLGTGTGSFGAGVNYSVGVGPMGLASNDFNGDGELDIATANVGSNDVSILFGTSLGTFSSVTNYSVGSSPYGITSGDFNGDGKLDLAVTDYGPFGGANVAVMLGLGSGSFGIASYYPGGTHPVAITSSDLNGDGKLDLAVLDVGGSAIYFLEGNGIGSFTLRTNYAYATGIQIIARDVNGDGKPDLISTSSYMHIIPILLNVAPHSVVVSSNPNVLCVGETLTLTATGASQYAWSNNGVPTPSIYSSNNNTVFIANTTSTYAVVGVSSITGCTANAIAQISISDCTGVIANHGEKTLAVFPNPATSIITFNIPTRENVTIEIYSQVGQLISRSENCSNIESVDISGLGKAVYFYKIIADNKFYSGKFCKIID